jgi:diguanylate cyclase (GGDEF)-like protein
MKEIDQLKAELNRTKSELTILYEISNAMRTTLKLEEILYIILTGVTAHEGLGFNRAVLFLVNEKNNLLEGKMGIGPSSAEEADRIWSQIKSEQMGLGDLIEVYKTSNKPVSSQFNQRLKQIKIPLSEDKTSLLSMTALDGMPLHLTKETISEYADEPVMQLFKTEELVIIPLKAKDKVIGLILADNLFTKKPISHDDIHMLIMLANQAGLAIENSRLYEETVIRAHQNSLTGLWNHGYFQYLLQKEVEAAISANKPLSLIMLDIDDFKRYNDTFGHQAGDCFLKELAQLMKNHSRKDDWVCRYGGEEFAIILPQTNREEAYLIAERLREKVENYNPNGKNLPAQRLTVSIGIACMPQDGKTPSTLIAYSDKLLYQAKKQGKNRTCC